MTAPAVIIPDFHAAAERHVRQPSLPLPTPGEAFDRAASDLRVKLSRADQIEAFDRVIDAAAERHVRQPSLPLPTPGEAFDRAASDLRVKLSRADQIEAFDRVIDAAHRLSSEQYRRGLTEGR